MIKKQPEEQLQYVLLPIAVSYKKLWATSVGLNEKVFFHHGLDPGSRSPSSLSTRFETFPLDSGSVLHYARNDKEESKEVRLFFTWVNLVETGTQTTEVQSF